MKGIAILYQETITPIIDGIQKPMKIGGYSDSGADIAYELHKNGFPVVTPVKSPKIKNDLDWVFPDSKYGIQSAIEKGATILWLNTVLYKGHAIESFMNNEIEIVGQQLKCAHIYDNKIITNQLLRKNNLPIPRSILISKEDLNSYSIHIDFPLVLKPIRGRGSQGVTFVKDKKTLNNKLIEIFTTNYFGTSVYAEQFLSGEEITITVMPPGNYKIKNQIKNIKNYWSLPAIKRCNHVNEIAPYSGVVAIMDNSYVLSDIELRSEKIREVNLHCEKAANLINAKAPIRIDCRENENGKYFLFDLNLKPNMTGASRAHRINQDSLSCLAAKKIGWNYKDLLVNMLEQRWKLNG